MHSRWHRCPEAVTANQRDGCDGKRAYEWPCIIRCINTVDVMTAEVPELDWALLKMMTDRILAEVPGICRVCYDLTQANRNRRMGIA